MVLRWVKRVFGRKTPTPKDAAKQASDDVAEGAERVVNAGIGRPVAAAIGGGSVAGSGAYIYGQAQDTERERERTARYNEYQARVNEIEEEYQKGTISKDEAERRKEAAWQAYRTSLGKDNAGATPSELFAQLTTVQMTVLAALAGLSMYVIVPRLFRSLRDAPSPEDIFG